MNREERLKTVWKDGKWHWADTGEAVNEGSPLQRLSEIVEAGTPTSGLGLVGVRLARFLCSPEAVEVLEETFKMMFVPAKPISCKDIAVKVLNTIAEQALKEPSHG